MLKRPADITAYLDRIGVARPGEAGLDALRALHAAHMRAVPFENLSVRRGERIFLDEERLFEKIVTRRRGGFCYELNGSFASLLDGLGFRVERLAARVYNAKGELGIPFDHMALRVAFPEPWLADVGFGDSFVLPIRLASREPQDGGDGRRYVLHDVPEGLLLLREEDGTWAQKYLFTLQPWPLSAFEEGCRFHQTSPDSPFTRKTVVSRATGTGRVTLSERRLIVTEGTTRREEELPDEAAVEKALAERFGIQMTG